MKRYRLNLYIDTAHARRLQEIATMRGVSKSSIVATALSSHLAPVPFGGMERSLGERMQALSRQVEALARDQTIAIETIALYVRWHLSITAPIPAAQQEAARAHGRERFAQFVAQLARHLQRGDSLIQDVHSEIYPERQSEAQGASQVPAPTEAPS